MRCPTSAEVTKESYDKVSRKIFFPDTVYFWDKYFSAFMNLPFLHKTFCSVRCHCSTYWQSFKLDVLSAALASPLTFRPILSPLSCKPCDLVVRLLDIRHLALVIAKQPASLTHVACSDLSWLECMIDDFASNSNPFHVVCFVLQCFYALRKQHMSHLAWLHGSCLTISVLL